MQRQTDCYQRECNTLTYRKQHAYLVIVELISVTELTADWHKGFLRDELSIGVTCIQDDQDQNVEQVERGTLDNNAHDDGEPERRRYNAP